MTIYKKVLILYRMERILTKDEIFVREELTKVYPQLLINARKTCGYVFDKHGLDLIAVCVEFYLNKDIEVQLKVIADGKLENYITFIMGMQLKSGSSKFYRDYRHHNEKQRDFLPNHLYGDNYVSFTQPFEDEEDECISCLNKAIEKLDPYLGMLVKERVINQKNFTDIANQYDLPYEHLRVSTKEVIKKLREECQHLR